MPGSPISQSQTAEFPIAHCNTLVELLRTRAASEGDRIAYVYLRDGEEEEASLTYGELDAGARAIAARLQELTRPGERALLLYPSGLEYIRAFFGCLYAGVIAVPIYPPSQRNKLQRLDAVIADSGASVILATEAVLDDLSEEIASSERLRAMTPVASDAVPTERAEHWRAPPLDQSTLAFLQYTSGSTGTPKGVMVSHGNLLHNEALIQRGFGTTRDSVVVGWLPLYHDMGLIGNVLQPLYLGAKAILMSPMAFLQKPLRWLKAISDYRGTVSGGPNFAYQLCLERIGEEDKRTLDLSQWHLAFNGAEPIRAETLQHFSTAFASTGFKTEAFFPCYGLAEATLFVSGSEPAEAPDCLWVHAGLLARHQVETVAESHPEARQLVSSGKVYSDQNLLIVDPETHRVCANGTVGEIWLQGSSVAQGYWQRTEATAETFAASIDATYPGAYLRTGDFGFLRSGKLFVTGRLKELIIIRGRNHYPQDIEHTTQQAHPALVVGGGAAFAVEVEGEERLVVVQEVQRTHLRQLDAEAVLRAVREAVADKHELQLHELVLIKPMRLPKTSSGKIQRRATMGLYREGALETLLSTLAALPTEAAAMAGPPPEAFRALSVEAQAAQLPACLRDGLAQLMKLPAASLPLDESLSSLGMDSLTAVQFQHFVESRLALACPLDVLLGGESLSTLAHTLLTAAPAQLDRVQPLGSASGPLSYNQESMWLLQDLSPESSAYNVVLSLRIRSPLDRIRFLSAWERLVARHAILRTRYVEQGGLLEQHVDERCVVMPLWHEAIDWDDARVEAAMTASAQRPFRLRDEPSFRLELFPRASGDTALLLVAHHIAVDLWTLIELLRELGSWYESPEAPKSDAVACQYLDFVRWQRDMVASPRGQALWTYWQSRLAGELPILRLPADRPRPKQLSPRGEQVHFHVAPSLSRNLSRLARRRGVTLYTLLLATYQVLLHKLTGQRALCIGTPVAGRSRPEFAQLAGYCVNTVVLRSELSGSLRFGELLGRTDAEVRGALAHQDLPFQSLVERLAPEREPGVTPLFQTVFSLQNPHAFPEAAPFVLGLAGAEASLGGLRVESWPLAAPSSPFELSLFLVGGAEGLAGRFEYAADLFDASSIIRLAERYRLLLSAVAADPSVSLAALDLMDGGERERLLAHGHAKIKPGASVYEDVYSRFRALAQCHPDVEALRSGGRALAYGELLSRAEALAAALAAEGAGPGTLVGVCIEPSFDLITAILAVLRTGAAYVPLDPKHPDSRLRLIADQARLALTVTEERLRQRLHVLGTPLVLADALPRPSAPSHPRRPPYPDELAYVIFTSGSTGAPKGVMLTHGGLSRLVAAQGRELQVTAGLRVLQFASSGFDASVSEIFVTLCAGATLCLESRDVLLPGEDFLRYLNAENIGMATLPPSVLAQLEPGRLPKLGLVLSAGEACTRELASRWATGRRFVNAYGPTEVTVCASMELCQPDTRPIGIGRGLEHAQLHVLDEDLRLVPEGLPGELYVGGAGLARGYVDRPDLTAERFVPNPHAACPGERLYRTGDRVRWLRDGRLEFLGRMDHQVKLRGFRIEPGEIEALLAGLDGVREAFVTVRDVTGEARLLAYFTARGDVPPEPADIRQALRERLPDYMVPAAVLRLDAFPLTVNGKIDTRALPIPELTSASYVAPQDVTESRVAALMAEVLKLPRVGVEDNFFDLGGHSLLASQLIARLRASFRVELPMRALFEAPTVAGLSRLLGDGATRVDALPLQPVSRDGLLPLSFAQQRLWFLDRLEGASATYNMPAAFHLRGSLNVAAVRSSFQTIVDRHESLRTRFIDEAGEPRQEILPALSLHIPVLDTAAADIATRIREHAQAAFDLSEAPLLRVALLRQSPEAHVLLVTMHHIVSDGWSTGVLVREFSACYAAACAETAPSLPPLPVQYADYADWQRRHLAAGVAARELDYWRQQLSGLPPLLELPGDHPRPPVQSYRGGVHHFALDAELAQSLQAYSRRHGVTPYMILLAAFQALLARHSGQSDIAVGSPVAGRDRTELEGLIGFFVNTLVLRSEVSLERPFFSHLAQVREMTLAAQAHQDLPFEQLVEDLKPARSLSHTPLFQVMFLLQEGSLAGLDLPGLEIARADQGHAIARFDLALNVEHADAGYAAWFDYAADLFEPARIERLATHYLRLLRAVVEPALADTPLACLPMLTEVERQSQLAAQSTLEPAVEPQRCVHQLVEHQAHLAPTALAARFEGRELSYAELDERANRLAQVLAARGIGPEDHVGVWLERSLDLLVCLLGIWKAGATYVPLDPGYPKERLDYIAADAQIRLLLTDSTLISALEAPVATPLCIDAIEAELAAAPACPPAVAVHGQLPAYVIYTSGSTGKPKGVHVLHSGLSELLLGLCQRFAVGASDSMPSLASHAFGISFVELLLPLVAGGHTRILSRDTVLDTARLAGNLAEVSLAHLVPSLMRRVIDHVDETGLALDVACLRHVFVGGDAVAPALLTGMQRLFPAAGIVEFYGQTETTILSCHAPQNEGAHPGNVIGRRLPHAQVYVLDELLQPLPEGSVGELHIGGHGIARGYLGRPDQTAEKFLPHPFSSEPGARLYRTGDLARLLPDGRAEYVGRVDHQINIRGFRVELGEIETVLRETGGIQSAVVTALEDAHGDKRLIAYLVARADTPVAVADIRKRLRDKLPDYMMPAHFVQLEALPLNANGKLDRKALPAPDPAEASTAYVAPRDEAEQALCALWAAVLGVERVGIHDNFFELGGHSLLAAQAMARVKQQFEVELTVQDFFEAQTVAQFAGKMAAQRQRQELLSQLLQGASDSEDELESFVL